MYIIIEKSTEKFAVIKDKKEIAHYINEPYHRVRRLLNTLEGFETEKYKVIIPSYVQSKSNSGGNRR